MTANDCKQLYGTAPESFRRRVAFALTKTEGKPMKHTVRTIVLVTLILLLLMAAAYAAFSSQVTEYFGRLYGNDTKEWLEQGDVAAVNQSLTIDGVVFTLDEVVYRNNGLYGIGTIRPQEGSQDVVIAEDHTPDEPFGYDIYGEGGKAETAPAGAPTIADVAKEKGGRIRMVRAMPDLVGVDGGTMLDLGTIGYSLMPQRDGSIVYSFEASDGFAIEEGQTYIVQMYASLYEMTPDGEVLQDTRQTGTWTAEFRPVPINEPTAEPAKANNAPAQTIGDVTLIVPEEYTKNGTLPVYQATARDFGASLQPELFNTSGIAKKEDYLITYNDEAQLSWAPEALFYAEYQGTYNGNYKNPELEPDIIPLETLSCAAADLAGDVYSGWPDGGKAWEGIALHKTALSGITLDEAMAKVEALLAALQLEGYACDYALDMDVERIRSMGAAMNRMIEENETWNSPIYDYSLVTEADEGFYLHYQNGMKADGDRFDVHAYVTAEGITDLAVRDLYVKGDVYSTPETLVAPETVMAALPVAMANSRFSDTALKSILSIELTYSPARAANKADGMVLTPAWYITYRDADAAADGYDCYAIFNAVDGTLLAAIFQ